MKTTLPHFLSVVTLLVAIVLPLRSENAPPPATSPSVEHAAMMKNMADMMEHMGGMMRGMAGDSASTAAGTEKSKCACCEMMAEKMDMSKESSAKPTEPPKPADDKADPHAGHANN